jgi:hypothetical protein
MSQIGRGPDGQKMYLGQMAPLSTTGTRKFGTPTQDKSRVLGLALLHRPKNHGIIRPCIENNRCNGMKDRAYAPPL